MLAVLVFRLELWFSEKAARNKVFVANLHAPRLSQSDQWVCENCDTHWPCIPYESAAS